MDSAIIHYAVLCMLLCCIYCRGNYDIIIFKFLRGGTLSESQYSPPPSPTQSLELSADSVWLQNSFWTVSKAVYVVVFIFFDLLGDLTVHLAKHR